MAGILKNEMPKEIFLASFFSGEGHAGSDTGLQIGISQDGREFWNITDTPEPLYTPENGLRDPHILYRNGYWYLAHSHGPSISPVIFILKSKDLKKWIPMCHLRLANDFPDGNNFIDTPGWITDSNGCVHVIACVDNNHHWVETHPLSDDPDTWSDAGNWSPVIEITDYKGNALIQGNTFVTYKDNTFYMAFNDIENSALFMRTSKNLVSGWAPPQKLDAYSPKGATESENILFLEDGTMRFYVSCSNILEYKIWYIESKDLGNSWSLPVMLKFSGFNHRVNWAQVTRVADPKAIASLNAYFQRYISHDRATH